MTNKKLWFVNKTYGYGWYPATWQGWVTILIYIVVNFLNFYRIYNNAGSENELAIVFTLETLFTTLILILVCVYKGEKPEWRWGKK